MSSLLNSTQNTRAILPDSLRYLRSDVPASLTESEINWLRQQNIRCIVDLRSEEEQKKKPCPLSQKTDFVYHSLPVSGGNAVPACPDEVSASYVAMVDEQMEHIIYTIETSDCGVLYFCNAGKDRTGVVSALLLRRLGYDDEYIIKDYLQSADNLKEMLRSYAASSGVDIHIITPCRRYMEEFLQRLNCPKTL